MRPDAADSKKDVRMVAKWHAVDKSEVRLGNTNVRLQPDDSTDGRETPGVLFCQRRIP